VDVRIGVVHSTRELDIELPEGTDLEQLRGEIERALGEGGVLWIADRRGRQVGVPVERVAYVEIGSPPSRIGFAGP
jgi:hypothetical protein